MHPEKELVSALICPTNGATRSSYNGSGVGLAAGLTFAKGNYAAFPSPVHADHQKLWPGAVGGFTPGDFVGQPLKRITDGLANTLLASEVRTLDRAWDVRGVWSLPFVGASLVVPDLHPTGNQSPYYVAGFPDYPIYTPNQTVLPDHLPACSQPVYAHGKLMPCSSMAYLAAGVRSRHEGGANAVAVDGHVVFLSNSIHPVVFAYLVSINDGQFLMPNYSPIR